MAANFTHAGPKLGDGASAADEHADSEQMTKRLLGIALPLSTLVSVGIDSQHGPMSLRDPFRAAAPNSGPASRRC